MSNIFNDFDNRPCVGEGLEELLNDIPDFIDLELGLDPCSRNRDVSDAVPCTGVADPELGVDPCGRMHEGGIDLCAGYFDLEAGFGRQYDVCEHRHERSDHQASDLGVAMGTSEFFGVLLLVMLRVPRWVRFQMV